jgi:hypothetical protein
MRAVVMIVADVVSEQTLQVAFVNCDDVIQEFAAATAYPTLRNSILPRTPQRSADRTYLQRSNGYGDLQPVLRIPVENESTANKINARGGLLPPLKSAKKRVWETAIPLSGDTKSLDSMFHVMLLFGFGGYV